MTALDAEVVIDHIALPSRDARRSAAFLAELLGLGEGVPEGPDGDMFAVHLDHETMLLYADSPAITAHHVALRVGVERFAAVVDGLARLGIAFGNDPEAQSNGQTDDPLGQAGRVYFSDSDGHLLEIVARR